MKMYNMYDEDNPDLEEEMYMKDIAEEENMLYNNDEIEEEYIPLKNKKLTKDFLNSELCIKVESNRHKVKFTDDKNIYEGIVLAKFKDTKYLWSVKDVSLNETKGKTKMFDFKKITLI